MMVHENTQAGFSAQQSLQDRHERLDAAYARAVVTEGVATEAED